MRKRRGNRLLRMGFCLLILAIVTGCAPVLPVLVRTNPQVQEKIASIKTIAIMPPTIKFYHLAVGGGTELMDEPTETTKQIVATAIEKELRRHAGVVFKPFPSASALLDPSRDLATAGLKDDLEDTQALFQAVSLTGLLYTYKHDPDETFPEKSRNFDDSFGPKVQRLAKFANTDALLFVSGVDYISTGGRKALLTLGGVYCTVIVMANPIAAAQCFGSLSGASGEATLRVALIDATTGALLWYKVNSATSLTYPEYAADLAERVFENFPLGMRPTRKESGRSDPSRIGGMN